jgi:hypothetical protein
VRNFNDPARMTAALTDDGLMRALIEEAIGRPWPLAIAAGGLGAGFAQVRQRLGLSPGHPTAPSPHRRDARAAAGMAGRRVRRWHRAANASRMAADRIPTKTGYPRRRRSCMNLIRASRRALYGFVTIGTLAACGGEEAAKPIDTPAGEGGSGGGGGGGGGGGSGGGGGGGQGGGQQASYAPLPEAMSAFGGRVLDDKLYVLGGHTGEGHDSSIESLVTKFRRLDLAEPGAQWEDVTGPDIPLQQGALFTYEGKLHWLGGMTSRFHRGGALDVYTLGDFSVYDAATSTWTALPPIPDTRSSHDVEVVGSTIYVTGGWKIAGGADTEVYYETWLSIDMAAAAPAWVERPQPFKVRDHCGGVADGKVYVLGGMLSGQFPSETRVYDPATDTWAEGPAIPPGPLTGGFGCAAATLNGTIYYSAFDGGVFKLNAARDGWEQVATLKVPRLLHRLVARNDSELIALGGVTGEQLTSVDSLESILLK